MYQGPLDPHCEGMHPDLCILIARQRHDELTNVRRLRQAADRGVRRRFWRRRRDISLAPVAPPAALVLPPPREERDPTGHGLVA